MAEAVSPNSSVRILVVDDFEAWRQHICCMLQTCSHLCVVAEAGEDCKQSNRRVILNQS
jgi:hypothetical protein